MTTSTTAPGDLLSRRIAAELRAEMGRQELSQRELAQRLGVVDMWLSRRIRGHVPVNVDELEVIARALGSDAFEFMARATRASRTEVTRESTSRTWPPRRSLLPGDRPIRLSRPLVEEDLAEAA